MRFGFDSGCGKSWRMRPLAMILTSGLVLGALAGCGGGHRMREGAHPTPSANASRPASVNTNTSSTSVVAPPGPVSVDASNVELTETQPTTPKAYAAAVPQKPRVTGLSEEALKRCEAELPPLENCKASGDAVVDEVRACIARYVATLDACVCQAGSKPHCQYAEDQKSEIAKMGK
jgi:hypothetical protein